MLTPEQLAAAGTEHAHQTALFAWIGLQPKDSPLRLAFAIPNGGLRNKVTAARMKAGGVRAGVPDIFLPIARGGYHGLFIEMKVGNGYLSVAQKDWIKKLNKENYSVVVCYGWENVKGLMVYYLSLGENDATNA